MDLPGQLKSILWLLPQISHWKSKVEQAHSVLRRLRGPRWNVTKEVEPLFYNLLSFPCFGSKSIKTQFSLSLDAIASLPMQCPSSVGGRDHKEPSDHLQSKRKEGTFSQCKCKEGNFSKSLQSLDFQIWSPFPHQNTIIRLHKIKSCWKIHQITIKSRSNNIQVSFGDWLDPTCVRPLIIAFALMFFFQVPI